MTGPEERLLDHALAELLGEERSDLAPRVLAAWRRGERGSLAPDELALLREAAESSEPAADARAPRNGHAVLRPVPSAPRRAAAPGLRRAAAAVVLLFGGGGLVWWAARPASAPAGGAPPPVAGPTPPVPLPVGPGEPAAPLDAPSAPVDPERFDALVDALYTPAKLAAPWAALGYVDRLPAMRTLSAALRGNDELWERFDRTVAAQLAEAEREAPPARTRERIVGITLDFLHQDRSDEALELARRLWLDEPEHFDPIHVVGFAEQGAFEFQREVDDLLDLYDPALDEPPVWAAAYLAFRGEGAVRQVLWDAFADPDPERIDRCLMACLALERLGDEEAWSRGTARMAELLDLLLERPDTVAAREAVLLYEHYVRARRRGAGSVGEVLLGLFPHLAERRAQVQTERQIRGLFASLAAD